MIHDKELDLFWADKPPAWVENIGPMMEIWADPIFQRRYVMRRLYPFFGVRKSFIIGLLTSAAFNLLFRLLDADNALGLGFLVTVIFPGIIINSITGLRFFTSCLIGTPLELRRELYSGMLGVVLASPVHDARIFVAECVAGLLRGLGAFEEIAAMFAGLALSFVVIQIPDLWSFASEIGISMLWWIVLGVMIVVVIIIINVMTTFAAGLYSILLPLAGTIPATILHVGNITILNLFAAGWLISFLTEIDLLAELPILIILLVTTLCLIISLTLMTALTSHLGVLAFANARRPGYYEPERANSARLLLRSKSDHISFNKSI